ncbi:MAG: hypothetical protein JWQ89_4131, partial [Devosia sp.]|uniref:Csu type fimbrial protein n=1 Tax=Devosia sp. TaxID=1871048 RepID=UPI0026051F54
ATCSATISDLNLGIVDTLSASPANAAGEVAITCDQVAGDVTSMTVCINLGTGSGGVQGGLRLLEGGTAGLAFGLFADSAHSVPWGSHDTPALGSPLTLHLPANGGAASGRISLYGSVFAGQSSAVAASYRSTFSGPDATLIYAEGTALDCSAPAGGDFAYAAFSVNATVLANCLVVAGDIDFGRTGVVARALDASGDLDISCTPGTNYSVGLDGGLTGATDPAQRAMTSGGRAITYGLYLDPARTEGWGELAGTTVAGTGTGDTEALTIYGRVPPQVAGPGAYSDTVVVSIFYD